MPDHKHKVSGTTLSEVLLLSQLVHELTLAVRSTYSNSAQIVNSERGSTVGACNEMQHQVANRLVSLLTERGSDIRSAEEFLECLSRDAEHLGMGKFMNESIDSARSFARKIRS